MEVLARGGDLPETLTMRVEAQDLGLIWITKLPGGRQPGSYPETGLWEKPNSVSNVFMKSTRYG